VHFVGGLVGSLLIGLFSDPEYFGTKNLKGLFHGGGLKLLGEQALANVSAIIWCAIVTAAIAFALKATIGLRVSDEAEDSGLDVSEHAETAYNL